MMDNLTLHQSPLVQDLIHLFGHRIVYCAPYWSCDGPIEYVFNTIQTMMQMDPEGVDDTLAGNVANMSRHVVTTQTCLSNFGQMGPCRRHKIEDVVAVCVGSSQNFPDFRFSQVRM